MSGSIRRGVDFTDQHVLVTGGGTGIGRHVAQEFAAAGATVTVLDREETPRDETRSTAETIRRDGGEASFLMCDITDADAVATTLADAARDQGDLDVVINNAGTNRLGTAEAITIDDWDNVIDVNFRGTFLVTKHALPSLKKTLGNVVNVASIAGLRGSPDYSTYGPSKAAVINHTKQIAADYADAGIRANAVAPGTIEAGMAIAELNDPETEAYKREQTLLDRLGRPEDVSNAVLFLASESASFITGETVTVDGGWTV